MKSKRLLASLLSVSLIASLALVGCGSKDENAGATTGEGGVDKEQYLNLLIQAEPKTLDQSKSTDSYSSQVLTNTQEGLTRIIQDESGNGKIEPAGAVEWKTSEDGLTWTFNLRDMKWSDGQPVTAQDYVYGITRTLDPNTASTYGFLLFPIKNATEFNAGKAKAEEVGVKAIDEKTLEFTLEQPCPYFLDTTYFKVMQPQRKDIVEKNGDKYGSEADSMVYSGPYVISEWVHQNQIVLTKNPEYWDAGNVKLEKATMKIIKEESARMNELLNGSLDMAAVVDPNWISKFNESGEYDVRKGYDGSTTYTFFNQKDKLFSNEKVRKAFLISEDREGEIKTLRKGIGEPAMAWCPPAVQIGGKAYRETVNYSPVKDLMAENTDAKALLSEGLKELGMDPDPSKITITYLQSGTDQVAKQYAEYRQQTYKELLGVNVECEYVEWPIFQQKTKGLEFQIASQGWTGDYNDPNTFMNMWTSTAGIVPTGWTSAEYDKLIEDAAKEEDQTKRADLFKQAEKILIYDNAVVSPGCWRFKNTYVRKYVKNYSSPLFGSIDLKYTYTEGRK